MGRGQHKNHSHSEKRKAYNIRRKQKGYPRGGLRIYKPSMKTLVFPLIVLSAFSLLVVAGTFLMVQKLERLVERQSQQIQNLGDIRYYWMANCEFVSFAKDGVALCVRKTL